MAAHPEARSQSDARLTAKAHAVLLAVVCCLLVAVTIGAVDHWVVQPAFARLQRTQALEDLQRADNAIQSELRKLDSTLSDWSSWDDTYRFAGDAGPDYVSENFSNWPMLESDTKINLCLLVGNNGRILYRGGHVAERGGDLVPAGFAGQRPAVSERLQGAWQDGQPRAGLVQTELGFYLVAARPILTTQGTGPVRGAMVMGRWLSPTLLQELTDQTQVAFTLFVRDDPRLTESERALAHDLSPGTLWIDPQVAEPAFVYQSLADLDGRPGLLLRTPIRNEISLVARQTGRALIGTLGLSGIALLLVIAWLNRRPSPGRAEVGVSRAWSGATLMVLVGLGLTAGAFAELREQYLTEANWILVIGPVLTLLSALYLYSLLTQQARDEAEISRRTRALADSEARLSGIIGHAPIGIGVFELQPDDTLVLIATNPASDHILARPCSRHLGEPLEDILPELRATERPRIYRQLAREGGVRYWDAVSYREGPVARDYEITAFQSAPNTVTVMIADITERCQAERALQRRDHLLQATAEAMAVLLSEPVFDRGIQSALRIVGETIGADRAYVFQNLPATESGRHRAHWLTAWRNTDPDPSQPDPPLRVLDYEPAFSGWWDRLAAGGSISGGLEALPPPAAAFLADHGVRSVLILPILIQNHFWGIMGFADCHAERAWSLAEDSVLRAVAGAFGNSYVRHHAEARQRLAAVVFESVDESIIVTDAERHILAVNRAFTEMTGYPESEVVGRDPNLLRSGHHPDTFYQSLWECLTSQGHWRGEFINRCKNGGLAVVLSTITEVRDEAGRLTNYVATAHDITQQKEAEQRIEHLAYFDPLTDLPNRSLLNQRADLALSLAARSEDQTALLFMDLDAFKDINDSLGHGEGDRLLQQAAERLAAFTRGSDTLSRLGGDEFVLLLSHTGQPGAEAVVHKILDAFRSPFVLADHQPRVTISIGVALAPQDGKCIGDLMKNADTALYQAKRNGRNTAAFFDPDMNRAAIERLTLSSELRTAIASGQLRAHYQPKVQLSDGRLLGAEALVRWQHPTQGLLLPGAFIPVIESSDLIIEVGDWMLTEVCRQLAEWQRGGYPPVRVAVNLAARHFRSPGLVGRITGLLAEHRIPAQWLSLELTESTLLDSGPEIMETMRSLQSLGVELAIDDFGTGYSSLSYLRDLPIRSLKIDRRFVRELQTRADDRVLAATIVALGHALGLEVIAEGVETDDQRAILHAQGCDQAQGFLFARPESPTRFADDWLTGEPTE